MDAQSDAVREARERAAGVEIFQVHVGRDGEKWVGQCQEVDVMVSMPDNTTMRQAIRLALIITLDRYVDPDKLLFVS